MDNGGLEELLARRLTATKKRKSSDARDAKRRIIDD